MHETHVLFHANCPDGFAAATVAWIYFGGEGTYIPVQYGEPLPEIADGSHVYIVDFSYPRDVLEALAARVAKLVALDHHKTAKDALADLPFATFDMTKCGAVLTWEYFFGSMKLPPLLRYIQDRDLWKWELPSSREISAFLSIQPRDFGHWRSLIQQSETFGCVPSSWVTEGAAVLTSQRIQTESLCDKAKSVVIAGFAVPAVNSPLLQSEIGEELCKRNPAAPFAAAFFIIESGEVVWSLRSRNGFDVSAVAKSYGGGGHTAAAGFKVPIDQLGGMLNVAPLE